MVSTTTIAASGGSASSSEQHTSILHEFVRELDAFTATRAVELADFLCSQSLPQAFNKLFQSQQWRARSHELLWVELERICWFAQVLAIKSFPQLVRTLLNWSPPADTMLGMTTGTIGTASASSNNQSTNNSSSTHGSDASNAFCHGRIALWLTAHVMMASLRVVSGNTFHDDSRNQDHVSTQVFTKSKEVFQQINLLQHKTRLQQQSSNSFFGSFKASSSIKVPSKHEQLLCDHVHGIWKQVVAKWCETLGGSLHNVKLQLTHELAKADKASMATREFFLGNFAELRLGLVHSDSLALLPTTSSFRASCSGSIRANSIAGSSTPGAGSSTFVERIKESTSFLRLLMATLTKANKTEVRKAGILLMSSLFHNELQAIDALQDERALRAIYNVSMSEWSCLLSDLHAQCMKMCVTKKEFAICAWTLRVQVVCMAANDIFARYWREDAHSLLKGFGTLLASLGSGSSAKERDKTHAKAVQSLDLVCFFLQNVLKRHFVSDRRMPMESEVMDFLNTIQAWCFSIPKHLHHHQPQAFGAGSVAVSTNSLLASMSSTLGTPVSMALTPMTAFGRVYQSFLVVLKQLSIEIAAYNLNYCVQNHLKRLLVESTHPVTPSTKSSGGHDALTASFDEKKLVGLETLVYLLDQLEQNGSMTSTAAAAAIVHPSSHHQATGPCASRDEVTATCAELFYYQLMDFKALKSSSTRKTFADIVGHLLVECHTHFGGELLLVESSTSGASSNNVVSPSGGAQLLGINTTTGGINSVLSPSNSNAASTTSVSTTMLRQEYRHALGLQIFTACLELVRHFFSEIDMKNDQKLMVIVRCLIHSCESVRVASQQVVQRIILTQRHQASCVVSAIIEYALRLSPHEQNALLLLMRQLHTIVRDIDETLLAFHLKESDSSSASDPSHTTPPPPGIWSDDQEKHHTLEQIEAICVVMLANIDAPVRLMALETLQSVQCFRAHEAVHEQLVRAVMEAPPSDEQDHVQQTASHRDDETAKWSVADYLESLETELDQTFCSLDETSSNSDDSAQHHDKTLWRLAAQPSNQARNGFRWSVVLSSILPRLCQLFPRVTSMFWSEIHDRALHLEPAIPILSEISTSSSGHEDLSASPGSNAYNAAVTQWRNLAILATSTARIAQKSLVDTNPIHSPGSPLAVTSSSSRDASTSVNSSDVRTLLKRLSRFLKSALSEQRKAAILVLGSVHSSCSSLLLEILDKYEEEAFGSMDSWTSQATTTIQCPGQTMTIGMNSTGIASPLSPSLEGLGAMPSSSSGLLGSPFAAFSNATNSTTNKKNLKALRAKSQKLVAQIHLQYALGRLHRLLLEKLLTRSALPGDATDESDFDKQLCTKSVTLLDKLYHSLDLACHGGIFMEANATFFMMQQDVCASLEVLLYLSHLQTSSQSHCAPSLGVKEQSEENATELKEAQPRKKASVHSLVQLSTKEREKWFMTLVEWSQGFQFLANESFTKILATKALSTWVMHSDVFGGDTSRDHGIFLWHWVDDFPIASNPSTTSPTTCSTSNDLRNPELVQELAAFQRFFLCQSAFSAMKMLLYGPFFQHVSHENAIFQWLEACFAIEPHSTCDSCGVGDLVGARPSIVSFDSLQFLCQQALEALLLCQGNDRQLVNFCVDKTLAVCHQPRIARHFFQAIATVAHHLQRELLDACDSCRLVLACLIHLGTNSTTSSRLACASPVARTQRLETNQPANAVALLRLLLEPFDEELMAMDETTSCGLPSGFLLNSTLNNEVALRKQLQVAHFCCNAMPAQSVAMALTVLRLVASSTVNLMLQRRLLALCLPWLEQIDLIDLPSPATTETTCPVDELPVRSSVLGNSSSSTSHEDRYALLGLLFRLTSNLHESCAEQLEQVWVALAKSARDDPTSSVGSTSGNPCSSRRLPVVPRHQSFTSRNLTCILQFLLCQRIGVRVYTSKLVLWWLVKHLENGQDQVLGILLDQLAVSSCSSHVLDDLAVAIVLTKEWSWALLAKTSSSSSRKRPLVDPTSASTTKVFAVQLLHSVLLLLYALVIEPTATYRAPAACTPTTMATTASVTKQSAPGNVVIPCWSQLKATTSPDNYQETLFVDIFHDVLVLLRRVLTQLDGSEGLVQSIYDEFASICAQKVCLQSNLPSSCVTCSQNPGSTAPGANEDLTQQLQRAMQRLITCLTNAECVEWTEECIQRFMKSTSLAATSCSSASTHSSNDKTSCATTSSCASLNSLQQKYEFRFCLLVYRSLLPSFDGQVLVALMALLQKALNDVASPSMVPLIQDLLLTMGEQVAVMSTSKLTLYPQILWVCVALLNHCKMMEFLTPTLQLLQQIICKPHFGDPLLQDVLVCKRPPQWEALHGTILYAIAQGMHDPVTLQLALQMTSTLLLLPGPEAICVSENPLDHAVLCTALFLPAMSVFLVNMSNNPENGGQESACSPPVDSQKVRNTSSVDLLHTAEQLAFVWQKLGRVQLSTAFLQYSKRRFISEEQFLLVVAPPIVQLLSFASSQKGSSSSSSTTCCELFFDALVRVLNCDVDEICLSTLRVLEELLHQGLEQRLWWRSQSYLIAALVRIVRSANQTRKWQIAVRILANCEFQSRTAASPTNNTVERAATSDKAPSVRGSPSTTPSMLITHRRESTKKASKADLGDSPASNAAMASSLEPVTEADHHVDNQSCAR